ncbi:hypothetical protein Daesc_002785 [Daldinia eschscholtzii]|uniref:Uncharacterized protein n=1 Tax=Daldinia eschscholtzii TaxID=292717 RepID=A0AAX6MRN0_9PEZI
MSQPVGSMKVNNNFLKDFIIAIAVAAVSTVVFLAIICVISQCAPRWFGRVRRREQWLAPTLEEGYQEVSQPDLPLREILIKESERAKRRVSLTTSYGDVVRDVSFGPLHFATRGI